jgi:hypothetical protein
VLTEQDIADSYTINRQIYRSVMRGRELPDDLKEHLNDKVWTWTSSFVPHTELPKESAQRLYEHAQTLLVSVPTTDPRLPVMRQAAESILQTDKPRPGYNYAGAAMKIHHALAFYSIRPNPVNLRKLEDIFDEIIPKDFDAEISIGLPVRGESFAFALGGFESFFA